MSIPRNANGIIDYCIGKVEEIDGRDDIDIEKKATLGLAYLKEAAPSLRPPMQPASKGTHITSRRPTLTP